MSFGGQNSSEKANDAKIGGLTNQLSGVADTAAGRGDKTFKFFKQSTKPAMDYWNTLLTGNRNDISQLLAPELGVVSQNAQNAKQNIWNSPRGGGKVSAVSDIENSEMSQMNNLFSQARPQAAEHLAGLGSLFGNLSLGESGQQVGALGGASNNLFGLNKEQQQVREANAQAWGSIGQGLGMVGATALTGGINPGGNKCCFIFLEATNGNLPYYVRELRDFYYYSEPAIRTGYVRTARYLVPLMQRFSTIKKLVNLTMVKPIISYGASMYNIEPYNKRNHTIKKLWFKIWSLIGRL